ncbi:hypothetical protein FOL47_010689 [Perkinsus chesapeaki]|uniref:Uncharacterized protein n=1 Tax=Perkinsus chesapeaki TaxID=330153 RepID=A0A7J6MP17_PERCH|nr:hypothetical protein FOL47_010689 [Perkinsus chesapeaki]
MPVGPLPELMSDIMAYTPRPTLTLDCPMEEIVLSIEKEPHMIFPVDGFTRAELKRTTWHNYHERVSHGGLLFVLHDVDEHENVVILTDYDLKTGTIKRHEMGQLMDVFHSAMKMEATGYHLVIGTSWAEPGKLDSVEVIYTNINSDEATVIWSSYDEGTKLDNLSVASTHPLAVDIVYSTNDSSSHSTTVVLERSAPIVQFKPKSSPIRLWATIRKTRAGYAILDKRLKRVSPVLNLPGNPHGTLCATDKCSGMYFLIKRSTKGTISHRLVRAFPYLNLVFYSLHSLVTRLNFSRLTDLCSILPLALLWRIASYPC